MFRPRRRKSKRKTVTKVQKHQLLMTKMLLEAEMILKRGRRGKKRNIKSTKKMLKNVKRRKRKRKRKGIVNNLEHFEKDRSNKEL